MKSNPYIWKQPVYHSEYVQRGLLLYLCPMCLLLFDFVFGWERERGNSLTFSHAFFFLSDSEKQFKHLVNSKERL